MATAASIHDVRCSSLATAHRRIRSRQVDKVADVVRRCSHQIASLPLTTVSPRLRWHRQRRPDAIIRVITAAVSSLRQLFGAHRASIRTLNRIHLSCGLT
jgi:hypothetical protein